MSKFDSDTASAGVEPHSGQLPDEQLSKAYQALKAEQPLPGAVKQRIMRQAKQANSQRNWRSWWYFSQLALGCAALVLVLSWVNPAKLPAYYQIDTITHMAADNSTATHVQWHHLTAPAAGDPAVISETTNETTIARQRLQTLQAQQKQLLRAGELSSAMQREVGLLTRHKDSWQIAMCDNLQLNVAIELVQQLNALMQLEPVPQPQWVELQFAPSGHILAIAALKPTAAASQCPAT
ncbi:hypothetical protein SAMN06297280_1975 [Arsukibacterium tuosuense]|uniref:Uncharacterized protein n=1 Tax=Arsukibacterium tuosuense TaxID=1323745 RepID=A0A285IUY7_9GAMM|nr:hypothetical protein [Arsukibacterium tuosuense]SNY51778.1 hypothetical protein SAMN06297280_1975 [Arsukibacterium tuosuense]